MRDGGNDPTPPSDRTVRFSPVALSGAAGAFVLIGALGSFLGPLLDTLSHHFGVSLASAGQALTVLSLGDLLGVVLAWRAVERLPGGAVLSADLFFIALGAAAMALAGSWGTWLAGTGLLGLGFGGVDFSLNTLLSRTAPEGRARRLTVINAGYGVGAVLGPLGIVALHPGRFRDLLWVVALAGVLLATTPRGVTAPALREVRSPATSAGPARRRARRLFVLAYVLYIAIETSTTGWMAAQIHAAGFAQSTGALVTAGFWAGVALGRGLGGWTHRLLGDARLVLGGLATASGLASLALWPPGALVAYPLMGLCLAAVFPLGLHWYTVIEPEDPDGVSYAILFMFAGGVLGPGLMGLLVSVSSPAWVPLGLVALALSTLGVFTRAHALVRAASAIST